jgi:hypothetical protein
MVVKVSSNINFPAQVNAESPVVVVKAGGIYTFSLDLDTLNDMLTALQVAAARVTVSDANHSMAATSSYIAYTGLTMTRTVTLPQASLILPATPIVIADETGNCSPTVRIIAQANGSEHINAGTQLAIETPYGALVLFSNGVDRFVTYP